ncbi:MAG: OmpH family outer membrane protein [Ferruginibacter sp.]|nr:OmpH family outer membrane protein [Chitinophagaceae bacterium]
MKNGMVIWNVILSLVAGVLLVLQLGSKKSTPSAVKKSVNDSTVSKDQFRIAYFEMDSVAANFDMVKELKSELISREEAINTEMNNRSKALQQKYNYYQNLDQAGSLTDVQKEAAGKEMQGLDEGMKTRKQQLDQDYNSYMMSKQNEIKSKIENFLKDYNKTKDYSYIVSYEQGLFYYRDTAYNITADVVKGLNEFYKQPKKNK